MGDTMARFKCESCGERLAVDDFAYVYCSSDCERAAMVARRLMPRSAKYEYERRRDEYIQRVKDEAIAMAKRYLGAAT